ncbi:MULTISPECIES: CapA family protein [Bacillaceae]|uniref:CapA family protein n=1 Tax=Evansella alkalicola TaxID=745819 RepID=A0ABS6JSE6_9BACI|nr:MULTISPECIES: CapA family protein [Bacillaceae]MBU9721413.1 CapA family protein [Bacillus alkalicola]
MEKGIFKVLIFITLCIILGAIIVVVGNLVGIDSGYTEEPEPIGKLNVRTNGLTFKNEGTWSRKQGQVEIIFVGDLMMDMSVKDTMDREGPDYPFKFVTDNIQQADLAVANLETAVTTRDDSYKDRNQLFNFKSKPEHLEGLVNAGFDLVSLGNNHALDYGEEGLLDTMEALTDYGIDYIGAGKDEDAAFRSQSYVINEKKINIMGASRFVPAVSWYTFDETTEAGVAGAYDLDKLVEMVKREKEGTDYLILYIHWGIERTDIPQEYQKYYVKKIVEAGVDAIVGHHPHWLQGFEYYEGVPVAYSLGNFLFPDYVTGNTAETGLLTLTIDDGEIFMSFKPYFIYQDQIIPLSDQDENDLLEKLERLSFDVDINGYEIVGR